MGRWHSCLSLCNKKETIGQSLLLLHALNLSQSSSFVRNNKYCLTGGAVIACVTKGADTHEAVHSVQALSTILARIALTVVHHCTKQFADQSINQSIIDQSITLAGDYSPVSHNNVNQLINQLINQLCCTHHWCSWSRRSQVHKSRRRCFVW